MAESKVTVKNIESLWQDPDRHVYAVLDGASIPNLMQKLYVPEPPVWECLYRGELEPDVAVCAPYLVELERDSDFTDWLVSGWGQHWGIFLVSAGDLRTVRFHLRKLNMVYSPEGKPLLFRYYDPRVMRIFAPTCSPAQLRDLFGPIDKFLMETTEPRQALALALADGKLVEQRIALV